jgi:poly-gamma-glutamate capsule biosynthesis protein CapA/YwtB (metallophosphatase superfamily)
LAALIEFSSIQWSKWLRHVFVIFLTNVCLTNMAIGEPLSPQDSVTVFMAGDVMTGRGIDQVLPYPGDPRLHEPYMKDARGYVQLAEAVNGPIQKPVQCKYIWGDALPVLNQIAPDVRLINLETSITTSDEYWPNKGIHYKMHPGNTACLQTFGIDYVSLANNHVLDWGYAGLTDTLASLKDVNIKVAGAGGNQQAAEQPAIMDIAGKGRVIVFSYGLGSSGIPSKWAAQKDRPGVNLLPDLSEDSIRKIKDQIDAVKQEGDIVVASIHWGSNWGYAVPLEHIDFAHRLIDAARVDMIHGHSSHHAMPLEVYRGKLIIYGSGDFLNDYEGIGGHEEYRGDLVLMYVARIEPDSRNLVQLQMIPLQLRQFRLNRISGKDGIWLKETLNREGQAFGTQLQLSEDNILNLVIGD